jgi:hypothetical protein
MLFLKGMESLQSLDLEEFDELELLSKDSIILSSSGVELNALTRFSNCLTASRYSG